jgi:F0F1-type ATP synthase assembly protein I
MEENKSDTKEASAGNKQTWWQPALFMFTRLSVWVAVPVVIATYVGNWIDEKNNSAPWGLISVVGVAFVVSMIGLVYEAAKEYSRIDKDAKK